MFHVYDWMPGAGKSLFFLFMTSPAWLTLLLIWLITMDGSSGQQGVHVVSHALYHCPCDPVTGLPLPSPAPWPSP